MPAKGKAAAKPKESAEAKRIATPPQPPPSAQPTGPPQTVNERSQRVFEANLPLEAARAKVGLSGLSKPEQSAWIYSRFARPNATKKLATKAAKDVWKHVNEANLPLRTFKPNDKPSPGTWGKDRAGKDVGEYTPEQFAARTSQLVQLTALEALSRDFVQKRDWSRKGYIDPATKEPFALGEHEVDEEYERRAKMAGLKQELYGVRTGPYAKDPEWDDVEPIPQEDPENALVAIAYPDDYAEAISYLRAVMLSKEYSHRCLRLTEHVISMNPAHYTVWLYRFSIISALDLSIPGELTWLNEVALDNLKNYQIWHHRHLLMNKHFPVISSDAEAVSALATAESTFLAQILAEDTKNYHVWSYRQYLVRKLGLWNDAELAAVGSMIDADVRNNSAWSHRFFIVFSDPAQSTAGSHSTEHDPAVPAEIVDREIKYAQDKILLAPQNQSPWNYLKGVLVKGGRKLASVEDFAAQFAKNIGDEEKEEVKSTHALDLLAEIYAEKGEKEKADLFLRRLGEKWDRIRVGYWEWRRKLLEN